MLRRTVLALSHRKSSIRKLPRQVLAQRLFSTVPQKNASPRPGPPSKPPQSGKSVSKLLVGSVALGTCLVAAYSTGYLDDILGKKQQSSIDLSEIRADTEKLTKNGKDLHDSESNRESFPVHTGKDLKSLSSDVDDSKSTESKSTVDHVEDSSKLEGGSEFSVEKTSNLNPKEESTPDKGEELPKVSDDIPAKGEELPKYSTAEETNKDENLSSQKFEDSADTKTSGQTASTEQHDAEQNLPTISEANAILQQNRTSKELPAKLKSEDELKDIRGQAEEPSTSLLDTYSLRDEIDERASSSSGHTDHSSSREETSRGAFEYLSDAYVSKDGKLILDFLQAIHAAEQRQAELDARVFAEERRVMKEKYEKELKDARARELMYAEEVAMLEKEVKKEKAKAAAALKSLQERLEQRLKMELEEKDREAESKLKEFQDFAKAELAASIAREKAAQVEKMAEADLNINALCMAFYARSEEARQTHSIHKLALGALALEDALSNGLPVQAELDALQVCVEGVEKDSLLQLALSSLPEDVRVRGTDSPLQLNQKFDSLKGTLRHFSLIPPGGGGILTHSLARLASYLKVKETDHSGDGIESVINKVEKLVAQGKLAEAADTLEDGVKGSRASEVVTDWLRSARNRAIAEQALALLQSYAISVSLS